MTPVNATFKRDIVIFLAGVGIALGSYFLLDVYFGGWRGNLIAFMVFVIADRVSPGQGPPLWAVGLASLIVSLPFVLIGRLVFARSKQWRILGFILTALLLLAVVYWGKTPIVSPTLP